MTVTLNGLADFTLETYHRVAFEGETVVLGAAALTAMQAARNRFETLLDDREVSIYGVTTGYGQNSGKRLTVDEQKAQAAVAPDAPNVARGTPAPDTLVRGIVFARLANFIEGHAAVTPGLATAVAEMLDGRPLPVVPVQGQGGSGEMLALSPLFANLPVRLREKEALSLINGAPCAAAVTADGAITQAARLDVIMRSFATAIEVFDASHQAYDPVFEVLWNNPDDAWALRSLRKNLKEGPSKAVQSPVSFRAIPRIAGQFRRAVREAQEAANAMLVAITDNPVITEEGQCFSNGGFHNTLAPTILDALTAANVSATVLVSRLATRITETADFSGTLREDGLSPYTFLPMAILGYEEEARGLASFSLPPGGEGGGYGVNDLSSPVFPAWSKQRQSGLILDRAIAALDRLTANVGV